MHKNAEFYVKNLRSKRPVWVGETQMLCKDGATLDLDGDFTATELRTIADLLESGAFTDASVDTREVCYTLELRSGARYDHSCHVPNTITDAAAIRRYVLMHAYQDKVDVTIRKDYREE